MQGMPQGQIKLSEIAYHYQQSYCRSSATLWQLANSSSKAAELYESDLKTIVEESLKKIDLFENQNMQFDLSETYQCLAQISVNLKSEGLDSNAAIVDNALLDKALDHEIKNQKLSAQTIYHEMLEACKNSSKYRYENPDAKLREERLSTHPGMITWYDKPKFVQSIKAAADAGRKVPQYRYAQMLHNGELDVVKNIGKAQEYYKKSAGQGYRPAKDIMENPGIHFGNSKNCSEYELSLLYSTGNGVQKNVEIALSHFCQAVRDGDPRALAALQGKK